MLTLSHHKPALQPEVVLVFLAAPRNLFLLWFHHALGSVSVTVQKIRSVKLTFCCCFLAIFKPGHFQEPVACRAEKKLLLVMATGRAGQGRAASFSGNGGCCWLTASLETQCLTPGHCLLGVVPFDRRPA